MAKNTVMAPIAGPTAHNSKASTKKTSSTESANTSTPKGKYSRADGSRASDKVRESLPTKTRSTTTTGRMAKHPHKRKKLHYD